MKRIIALLSLVLFLSSCKVGRFIWYNFSDITDHEIFPSRPLHRSDTPFRFYELQAPSGRVPRNITDNKGSTLSLGEFLKQNETVAFLIIKQDTILYEEYFSGYERSSVVASFSMAKSYTSALIGCAIADGYIRSVDEPVTNYLPEMKQNGFDKVTIKHLLQMTAALDFNESYYNPFGDAATFYYGRTLRKNSLAMKLKGTPGQHFRYVSGSTQLLGAVLDKALKGKTITAYLDEKIWIPLGMEYDASWSIDKKKDGMEKTFCCINARARDFAKFGRLFLNNGNWNGRQVVPESWVKGCTRPEMSEGGVSFYKYQWWLSDKAFYAQGHLGEYIYVYPSKQLIIVRLGSNYGNVNWPAFFDNYAEKME